MLARVVTSILVLGISSALCWGEMVDFETVPGDVPEVGLVITDQYEADSGLRFSMSDGSNFQLGDYGGPPPGERPALDRFPGRTPTRSWDTRLLARGTQTLKRFQR